MLGSICQPASEGHQLMMHVNDCCESSHHDLPAASIYVTVTVSFYLLVPVNSKPTRLLATHAVMGVLTGHIVT